MKATQSRPLSWQWRTMFRVISHLKGADAGHDLEGFVRSARHQPVLGKVQTEGLSGAAQARLHHAHARRKAAMVSLGSKRLRIKPASAMRGRGVRRRIGRPAG